MNQQKDIQIRAIKADELKEVLAWMEGENWTSASLQELQEWHEIYPQSFIGAYDSTGKLQSHIFNRNLRDGVALIEMFITHPESRRKGFGSRLFQHAIRQNPDLNTVLVSVKGAVQYYLKQGLKHTGEKMIRMNGLKLLQEGQQKVDLKLDSGIEIKRFDNKALLDQVLSYDYSVHGMESRELIQFLSQNKACVCVCAHDTALNNIKGFVIIKQTPVNYKLVMFFADTPIIAESLLTNAISLCPEASRLPFSVAFMAANLEHCMKLYRNVFEIAESNQLQKEECFLSSTGTPVDGISWDKVYSVSELGYLSFV